LPRFFPTTGIAGALVLAALASWPRSASAGGGAATDAYDGIRPEAAVDVHGLLDVYAQGNLTGPWSRLPLGRAFDDRAGAPSLGLARVTLAHAPSTFGFRLDLGAGDLANAYLDYDPARAAHADVARATSYIEQAFATVVLPVGEGVHVDVGKFGTPVGFEDNENLENWNYSRGLLFTLAEPTYHSGARATYSVDETFALTAFWLNGWNTNVLEGNGMRSLGAAATWAASEKLLLVADYVGGPERASTKLAVPTLTFRNELDTYSSYELTDRVTLAATGDYGRDAAGGGSAWYGVGGFLRYQVVPWLAGAIRGEHFADRDGFTTGTKQRIAEATTTVEARYDSSAVAVVGRLEYRRDQSDTRVFGSHLHQDTVTLGVVTAF
jgi:hypothetical protein